MDITSVIVIVAVILFFIQAGIGAKFADIAEQKGYKRNSWSVACVIFGLPVWLMIIALPNEKQHKELLAALGQVKATGTDARVISDELPDL